MPSCACTEVKLSHYCIKPCEASKLLCVFSTNGKQGDVSASILIGYVNKGIDEIPEKSELVPIHSQIDMVAHVVPVVY